MVENLLSKKTVDLQSLKLVSLLVRIEVRLLSKRQVDQRIRIFITSAEQQTSESTEADEEGGGAPAAAAWR